MQSRNNPLIGESKLETAQNAAEALSALIELMSHKHSNLCRLMSPIAQALDFLADDSNQ